MCPTMAIIAMRPCLTSAYRSLVNLASSAPSRKPSGSLRVCVCERERQVPGVSQLFELSSSTHTPPTEGRASERCLPVTPSSGPSSRRQQQQRSRLPSGRTYHSPSGAWTPISDLNDDAARADVARDDDCWEEGAKAAADPARVAAAAATTNFMVKWRGGEQDEECILRDRMILVVNASKG
jgi:hypothetical protein